MIWLIAAVVVFDGFALAVLVAKHRDPRRPAPEAVRGHLAEVALEPLGTRSRRSQARVSGTGC